MSFGEVIEAGLFIFDRGRIKGLRIRLESGIISFRFDFAQLHVGNCL